MSITVTLLGTGTPAPNAVRCQSATVVEIGEDLLLFDAGRGTVHQMARARVEIGRVNPVFITHHHVDHISDLFDVVITTALEGRTRSLRIFGPAGTRQIVGALIDEVYARDLRTRDPGLIGVVETELTLDGEQPGAAGLGRIASARPYLSLNALPREA